jgi:hypothetical protein
LAKGLIKECGSSHSKFGLYTTSVVKKATETTEKAAAAPKKAKK